VFLRRLCTDENAVQKKNESTRGSFSLICSVGIIQAETVVIGHRGGQASETPENTLVCIENSFSRDIFLGDEVDVRKTSDGEAMMLHDGTIDRITDGSGAFGSYSADEIRALDAGSWKGSQFEGEKVPNLVETLDLIKSHGSRVYLDIKDENLAPVQLTVSEA